MGGHGLIKRSIRKVNLGLRLALGATRVSHIRSVPRPPSGALWEEGMRWIRSTPATVEDRRASFLVSRTKGNTVSFRAELMHSTEGRETNLSMSSKDYQKMLRRIKDPRVVAHCDVRSRLECSSPPSVDDMETFKEKMRHLARERTGIIHILCVVDRYGVWFLRDFISLEEQSGALKGGRPPVSLGQSAADHVERVRSIWSRDSFQERNFSVDDVRRTPEFALLHSAFAEAGMYGTYLTYEEALEDVCGMHHLYTLDRP